MCEEAEVREAVKSARVNEPIPPLEVRMFGGWEARVHGQPLPAAHSQRRDWLLAFLLLRGGRPVHRSLLTGLLWPDSEEAQAQYNLRRNLSEMRRALGPEAARLSSPYDRLLSMDLSGTVVDVQAFDAAVGRGDAAALEEAVRVYHGPLLPTCDEAWLLPERAAREEAYLAALERLADEAVRRGEFEAAAHYSRLAVAVDPLRESAQRALLRALIAADDTAAASVAYREFRLRLHHELNAAPGPEIVALFAEVRARARTASSVCQRPWPKPPSAIPDPHSPIGRLPRPVSSFVGRGLEAGASTPRRLPRPLSPFVGRETALHAVETCLDSARLVTLMGPGGVGKTRLAIQVADAIADDYVDGVWFVDLTRLSDPALVPQAVAAVFDVPEQPDRPLTETLAEFLRPKQLLLVLDNCEHLLPACVALLEALLSNSPELQVLATSRQSLGLAGEVAWQLAGLSVPPAALVTVDPVPEALQFEAVRLFVERARGVASTFSLTEGSVRSVGEICRRLEGIPLAIELAAARVKALSVMEIAARLDDSFRLLTGGSRTAAPRQQTLRATMDWSYELLSEPERLLLRRLAVFAGSYSLKAVEAVCGDTGDEVLDWLTQLVDRSLVVVEAAEGETRYRLLETVRQYARERLQEASRSECPGEAEAVGERHARFYLELAERAAPYLVGADQVTWLERLDEERVNLRAALEWSLEHEPEMALRLGAALAGFWEERWHLAEGRQWLAAVLERAGPARRSPAGAAALAGASALAILQDDSSTARALLEESQAIRLESGDRAGLAASLAHLAHLTFLRGDSPAARALYEESLAIHKERGDAAGIATVLTGLGHLARREEEYAAARLLHEESLAIWQELGDLHGMGRSLSGLGHAAREQGDVAAARRYYEAALAIWRKLGGRAGVAGSLAEIADLAWVQGDYAEARRLREESLALWRAVGSRIAVLHSLGALGHLAREQGDYQVARRYYVDSLRLRQEAGDAYTIVQSLEDFAELAACEQQWGRLTRLLGAAAALREAIGKALRSRERAEYDRFLSGAREALGKTAVAAVWEAGRSMSLEEAIAFALQTGGL